MKKTLIAAALLTIGMATPGFASDVMTQDPNMPTASPSIPPGGDTLVVLVSDTAFGPNMSDANIAARFYCSTRGKLTTFVGKEHPPEMNTQVFQQWAVVTYRCISAATAAQ